MAHLCNHVVVMFVERGRKVKTFFLNQPPDQGRYGGEDRLLEVNTA
jgi:hypothetical protein